MKQLITSLKISSLSMLAITSLATTVTLSTATSVQAQEFKSMNGSNCQSIFEGLVAGTEMDRSTFGTTRNTTTTNTYIGRIYCSLLRYSSAPGKLIRVFLNYRKIAGSSMWCNLRASYQHGANGGWSNSFTLVADGVHRSAYAEIYSYQAGSATVVCHLRKSGDRVSSINYLTIQ